MTEIVKKYKHKIYSDKASNMLNAQTVLSSKSGLIKVKAPTVIMQEIENEQERLDRLKDLEREYNLRSLMRGVGSRTQRSPLSNSRGLQGHNSHKRRTRKLSDSLPFLRNLVRKDMDKELEGIKRAVGADKLDLEVKLEKMKKLGKNIKKMNRLRQRSHHGFAIGSRRRSYEAIELLDPSDVQVKKVLSKIPDLHSRLKSEASKANIEHLKRSAEVGGTQDPTLTLPPLDMTSEEKIKNFYEFLRQKNEEIEKEIKISEQDENEVEEGAECDELRRRNTTLGVKAKKRSRAGSRRVKTLHTCESQEMEKLDIPRKKNLEIDPNVTLDHEIPEKETPKVSFHPNLMNRSISLVKSKYGKRKKFRSQQFDLTTTRAASNLKNDRIDCSSPHNLAHYLDNSDGSSLDFSHKSIKEFIEGVSRGSGGPGGDLINTGFGYGQPEEGENGEPLGASSRKKKLSGFYQRPSSNLNAISGAIGGSFLKKGEGSGKRRMKSSVVNYKGRAIVKGKGELSGGDGLLLLRRKAKRRKLRKVMV